MCARDQPASLAAINVRDPTTAENIYVHCEAESVRYRTGPAGIDVGFLVIRATARTVTRVGPRHG